MAVRTCRIALAAVFLLPALVGSAGARGSGGTEFWLAFPSNLGPADLSLFITAGTATSGTVEVPSLGFSQAFDVTPGQVTTVAVPADAQITQGDAASSLGVHVTANGPVTVYGLNRIAGSTDAYLGLPVDAVGTDYLVLGYGGGNSELAIVGTQDATTVTLTPPSQFGDHPAGQSFQVVLNQGQTYELQGSDVSGTIIGSDKPVSVFGGAACVSILGDIGCNHLVEQLPPTDEWGKTFVTEPLATRANGDTFRILASQDGTSVQVDGQVAASLDRGEFYETVLSRPSQIVADKPVLVMQYANSSSFDNTTGDPFQMMVPPVEQFLASYDVSTATSDFTNYINVVAPAADVGSVLLDGTPIPAASFAPTGSSGFSGAQLAVAPGAHTLSAPESFGVSVYGWSFYDGYGYPGGLGTGKVATVATVSAGPKGAKATTGTQQCVEATVTDATDAPLPDIGVNFSVTGANSASGFALSDATGTADFCYAGANAGTDTVSASAGGVSDDAARTWTSAPGPTPPPLQQSPPPPPPRTDVALSAAGPSYVRVGGDVTFTDAVSNAGPDGATGVEVQAAVPAGAAFVSATLSNGNACRNLGGTVTCFVGTLAAGGATTMTLVLATTQIGTLTQSASAQADFDDDPANNAASATTEIIALDAPPPPPPPPSQPGTFNAVGTGTVMVNGQPLTPDTVTLIDSGATIDVTNGLVTLTDSDDGFGTFSNQQPSPRRRTASLGSGSAVRGSVPAAFTIGQPAKPGAAVTLTLAGGNFAVCGKGRRLAAKNQTAVRQLWGQAKGQFTTKGSYSAATIRGTTWLTRDRCDGTLTRAVDDVVTVVDFAKHTTVTLQPGESYLAVPKAAAKKRPRAGKK